MAPRDFASTESDESGLVIRRKAWTPAFNYVYRVDDPYKPDTSGNAWLVNLQVRI